MSTKKDYLVMQLINLRLCCSKSERWGWKDLEKERDVLFEKIKALNKEKSKVCSMFDVNVLGVIVKVVRTSHHQVGRVVKAPDLRSGFCIETWVRTPHLVDLFCFDTSW